MKRFMKMKAKLIIWSLALLSLPVQAEGVISGKMRAVLTTWSAKCQPLQDSQVAQCDLPASLGPNSIQSIELALAETSQPGQAGKVAQSFSAGSLVGVLSVFSVDPQISQQQPPYLQIRIELTSPVRAVCIESVKWTGAGELPPLICTGLQASQEFSEEFGLTAEFYISSH